MKRREERGRGENFSQEMDLYRRGTTHRTGLAIETTISETREERMWGREKKITVRGEDFN